MTSRVVLPALVLVLLAGCDVATAPGTSPSSGRTSVSSRPANRPTGAATPPAAVGFRVREVVVRADPFRVSTTCPATITFAARISVTGRGTVTYRWRRSDNATTPIERVRFDGVDVQNVVTTWTLGRPRSTYDGWQVLEIIEPRPETSERASFTLTCS